MKRTAILLFLVYFPSVLADQNVDRYGVLPSIQKMTISPDGEKIAFRQVTLESDFVSITSVNPLKRITTINVSSVKPDRVRFIDNDHLLLNVSDDGHVAGVRQFEVSTAMTYNFEKKKFNQMLTPGKDDVYVAQEGMGRIVGISPDGEWAYMPAFSGKASYVMGRQLAPPLALFKVKLSGGRVRIHKRGVPHVTDYFVNSGGKVVAVEVFNETENLHEVLVYKGKKPESIFSEETPYITKSFIGVSLDEQHMVMLDNNKDTGRTAIYKVAFDNGKVEGPLYDKEDADIVGVINDWQRKVIGIKYSGLNPSYTFFDPDLDQRFQAILAAFPAHSVHVADISPDRKHVLVLVEGSQSSGDYFLFSKDKNAKFIASKRPDIPADQIHPIGTVKFKARDGLEIPTLITIPKDKLDNMKNLPAVVMPHGGPASFDTIGFDYLAQALAEQGYLVIQPQFRGSSGFGSSHLVAGYGEWGNKMQHDLTDAVMFFTTKGMVDENRVCIVGSSYGGYAALAGGAFTPGLYQCVVSENGIGNLKDFQNRVRQEEGTTSADLAYWNAQINGFGETSEDVAAQRSPELSADTFKAPVLLIYSEKDKIVPPRQSVTMYDALKKANKQVEKLKLEGNDHHLSQGETRLQALRATIDFVNRHIQ